MIKDPRLAALSTSPGDSWSDADQSTLIDLLNTFENLSAGSEPLTGRQWSDVYTAFPDSNRAFVKRVVIETVQNAGQFAWTRNEIKLLKGGVSSFGFNFLQLGNLIPLRDVKSTEAKYKELNLAAMTPGKRGRADSPGGGKKSRPNSGKNTPEARPEPRAAGPPKTFSKTTRTAEATWDSDTVTGFDTGADGFGIIVNEAGFVGAGSEFLEGEVENWNLDNRFIALLWDSGWAVGKVSYLDMKKVTKARLKEIKEMDANVWVRYDDGFYLQRLETGTYLDEKIHPDDQPTGTWCLLDKIAGGAKDKAKQKGNKFVLRRE